YHEYPQAPKAVVDKYKALENELEQKQDILREMQTRLALQLAQSLAFETQKYLEAVYLVAGPQKKELAPVVEDKRLDYELLERWIKYMEKAVTFYPYKKPWQDMMKQPASTAAQAKRLAQQFQEKVVEVMLAHKEMNDENQVIADKALPTTKKKKRANKPNE